MCALGGSDGGARANVDLGLGRNVDDQTDRIRLARSES